MTQADDQGLSRFAELVDAHGTRPDAWPEAEREWASRLLETSLQAQRIAAGAAEIDGWLDILTVPDPAPDLGARILARAPAFAPAAAQAAAPPHEDGMAHGLMRRWRARFARVPFWAPVARPVYAAACAALFGLLLGWGGAFSQSAVAGEEEEMLALAFVGGELENYDLGDMQ